MDSVEFKTDDSLILELFASQESDNDQPEKKAKSLSRKSKNVIRRAISEVNLLDILPHDLKEGHSYHVITSGDVDSLSFLKCVIRAQPLHYLLFSTWCMASDDVAQFDDWVKSGKITRLDAYCGEIFPGTYAKQHAALKTVVDRCNGRVAIFRNHSKIYAGIGEKYAFAIESSANINTNPRTEQTTIHIGTDIYEFYKAYFYDISSFSKDYPDWKPWETNNG